MISRPIACGRNFVMTTERTGDFPRLGSAPAPMQSFAAGGMAAGYWRVTFFELRFS